MKTKRFIVSMLLGIMLLLSACFASAAGGAIEMPEVSSPQGGVLRIGDVKEGTVVRIVLPDGSSSDWFRFGPSPDFYNIAPLDAGEYRVEVCAVSALTVINANAEFPHEKYDLWTDVPEEQILTIVQTVEAAEELPGNTIDLSLGDVILSSSFNDFHAFATSLSPSALPQPSYVSRDGGNSWLKLAGTPEIINRTDTDHAILMGGDFSEDGSFIPGEMCDISIFLSND